MYHFLKPLTCTVCGMKWGSTFNEGYIKLGRPVLECTGCWEPVHTGCKEWADLSTRQRASFFAQILGYAVPALLFVLCAIAGVYFYAGGIDDDIWGWCLAGFVAAVAVLFMRAVLQVVWSLRRTAGRAPSPSAGVTR